MNTRYRTPLKKVRGLGSAKHGTHHFMVQRLTAIALVFLACWFLYFVIGMMHADFLTATDAVETVSVAPGRTPVTRLSAMPSAPGLPSRCATVCARLPSPRRYRSRGFIRFKSMA